MSDLPEFAHLLRIHLEQNGRSPNWLAQQLQLNPETVTVWLEGQDRPQSRETVVRIVEVLPISNPEDQHAFLHAAGYEPPSQPPPTHQTNIYGSIYGPVHTGSGAINVNPLSLTALKEWLDDFFRWSQADEHAQSSWEGMVLWSFSTVLDRLGPQSWLIFLEIIVLWIATSWLVVPFLQWPLEDPQIRLSASIRYAAASVFSPLVIAITTTVVQQSKLEIQTKRDQWTVLFLKTTGALVGFASFSGVLLILAMTVYYFTLSTLPAWLWYGLIPLPLLFSYIVARRIPIDRYKMFGPRPQLHEADRLFFVVFLLFGPFLGGFVYLWYDLLAQRIMGFAILLVFIAVALWEQRKRDPAFLSEATTIVLVGLILPTLVLLLFIFFSGQLDNDILSRLDFYPQLILVVLYVLGLITVGVTLLLRNRPNLTLSGALSLLAVLVLLNTVLAVDITFGRWLTIAVVLIWILWGRKRFRQFLWVHITFPLMLNAIGVSFYLVVIAAVPILANALGFGFVATLLILWAYQSPG